MTTQNTQITRGSSYPSQASSHESVTDWMNPNAPALLSSDSQVEQDYSNDDLLHNYCTKTENILLPESYRTSGEVDARLLLEEQQQQEEQQERSLDESPDALDQLCIGAEGLLLPEEYRTEGDLDLEQENEWERDGLDEFFEGIGAGFDDPKELMDPSSLPRSPSQEEEEAQEDAPDCAMCCMKNRPQPQTSPVMTEDETVIRKSAFCDKSKSLVTESDAGSDVDTESESDDSNPASPNERRGFLRRSSKRSSRRSRTANKPKRKFWCCKSGVTEQVVVME